MSKQDAKPVRTFLFVAGTDEEKLQASMTSGADAVIVDLEEPKTPYPEHEREATRHRIRAFFDARASSTPGTPRLFVRVQPPDTGQTLKDLRAVMGPALAGIFLPKVHGPEDVYRADGLLTCLEAEQGRPIGSTVVYPILETAQSVRLAYDIAMASERVEYLGGAVSRFGDIHQAVGFRWSAEGRESLFIRSKVLIDVRAAGIKYPISGMWGGATDDVAGLRRWATELRDLGYFGMMISQLAHVPIVNEIFSPTQEDIAYWQDLDRMTREVEEAGSGIVTYGDPNQGEGYIVHIAHVGSARKMLEWARDLGMVG